MFDDFRFARYRAVIAAGAQGLYLPPYKGSTLRGGFGHVFRRLCCSLPGAVCLDCLLSQACPYAQIFEPAPPPGSTVLKNYTDIPRPFVIEPPLDTKTYYAPGEQLAFNLVLIGQAVSYLPYFILAFKELGNIGLGKGRLPYELADFQAVQADGTTVSVYNRKSNMVSPAKSGLSLSNLLVAEPTTAAQIKINLVTMTRLKFDHTLVTHVPFHVLIRNLLRRTSTLYYFYHGYEQVELDFKGIIAQAEQVKTLASSLQLVDWERYSQRKDVKMNMGGLVGEIVYEGDFTPFWPLLKLGEVIHVGKGCVFGLGKYEVQSSPH